MHFTNRIVADVNLDTASFSVCSYAYDTDGDPQLFLPPSVHDNGFVVADIDLTGLTPMEFYQQKKPVIVDGAFDSWSARAPAPSLVADIDPPDDGSLACTVTLDLGVMDSTYVVTFPRPGVSCNLQDCKGVIDAQGDATFKIKVFGPGDFILTVAPDGHSDFIPATLSIHVVAGGF